MFSTLLKKIFPISFLITIGNLPLLVQGQPTILDHQIQKEYRLDVTANVLIDSTGTLSFEEAIGHPELFRKRGNLVFGYEKDPIWLKFELSSKNNGKEWYLEIPAPFLEYVNFYMVIGDTVHYSESGYYRAHTNRQVSHTGHILPLKFSEAHSITIYIKVSGQSPKTFPIYAIEKETFAQNVRWNDIGYGVFFGILIVMFFFNLFIYMALRQTNYLLYICTIICTFLIFSSASGYAGKFLWPETPILNYYAGRLSLGVLTIFLATFTIRFLEVKQYSRIMYYALLALIPLGILSMILISSGVLPSAGNNLISISIIIYIITGVVCRINGNKTATFFIAAWTIYFIGGLLLTLRNSGFFVFNFWTTHFVEIGAVLETVIIAFALGDQYRRLRKDKENAQRLALKIQLEATERLEQKVIARTEELSKANTVLQEMLQTNQEQTKIIETKNAELDAFFYRISHDLRGPVSSLLGLSTIAQMEVRDANALDYLQKQHQQIERLNTIIIGLINLTKLSYDQLEKVKIDFNKLIDDCLNSFNGFSNYNKITFHKEIAPNLEFHTSLPLLNAILQNLIENAIKYSSQHSPFVRISITEAGKEIVLKVEDNGQGIPSDHQSKIFDMFYRASQNTNGTGLGLYILKRSVDKLGGKISVESRQGQGSLFTINLPR